MKRKQPVLWLERKFDKHLQVWKERENIRSGRAFRTCPPLVPFHPFSQRSHR